MRNPFPRKWFKIWLLTLVGLSCLIPSLCNLAGINFSLASLNSADLSAQAQTRGLLLHTIFLWTATCMAFFTFVLAFFHYYVRRDIVTPVIGISLAWGGFMDLFQTLAVDRFIQSSVDNSILIPLTWAIGRSFGIFILLLGVMILMVRKYKGRDEGNTRFFILLTIAFGLAAFGVMNFIANSPNLPQITFPNLFVSRPWDVIPLFMYALAGLWIFRAFHSARRDHFSFSIWVSVIPDIVAQLHMAFGSTELFDNSYNIAHGLKVISYLAPAMGLLKDYVDINLRLNDEIQARKETEQARQVLSSLVDNTSEMVAMIRHSGEVTYMNQAFRQSFCIIDTNHQQLNLQQLLPQAEAAPILRTLFERVQNQGHTFGELEFITRDGARLVPVEYSLFRVPSDVKQDPLLGLVMRDITAHKQSAEDRLRHEQVLRRLISQRTSELAQMNEKMRAELDERKHLEERLVEAQKMEAMGQLSAGIAHEINNPIGFVNVNLEMLSRYLEAIEKILAAYEHLDVSNDPNINQQMNLIHEMQDNLRFDKIRADIGPMIEDSRQGIARVIDIVRSLRAFAHPEASTLQQVNLEAVMEDSLRVAWNQVKRYELKKEFEEIPAVPGFPIQISQVFVNLLVNAAQAMEGNGTITVKIMRKGNHAVVVVSDTGKGIAKEHYSRLFDPFFTTKPVGEGTGLGLYISYGIIQKHHGDLIFRSEVGKGTSFQIILPLH